MRRGLYIALAFFFIGCAKDHTLESPAESTLPAMYIPADNALTTERFEFGKALFFDERFSSDNEVSCASCHQPSLFFANNEATTPGANQAPGTRNVPSLINIGYSPYFTREGGVPSLEMQVSVPVQEHNEFNSNMLEIAEELNADPELKAMSMEAYGEEVTPYTITRGLANYQRHLNSFNSPYDQALRGVIDLNASAERGQALFFSERTQCGSCHNGINLTSNQIVNNGLYENYTDPGLQRLTNDPSDEGKFKVAGLRNVAFTAPYMHDGSLATLEEVINHYSSGGASHTNKDSRIQAFDLTEQEKQDLISFLEALTDVGVLEDPVFREK